MLYSFVYDSIFKHISSQTSVIHLPLTAPHISVFLYHDFWLKEDYSFSWYRISVPRITVSKGKKSLTSVTEAAPRPGAQNYKRCYGEKTKSSGKAFKIGAKSVQTLNSITVPIWKHRFCGVCLRTCMYFCAGQTDTNSQYLLTSENQGKASPIILCHRF